MWLIAFTKEVCDMPKKLILASASPRRRDILDTTGYVYEVIPSDADEIASGASPDEIVIQNALAKAIDVGARYTEEAVIVGADTVVCLGDRVLGKPKDRDDAFAMLRSLSGSVHTVKTGYAVVCGEHKKCGVCTTEVKFISLSDEEINAYIDTNEPNDKAGSYAVQEKASVFVERFNGDYFNIIGLPIAELYPILKDFGIFPDWQKLYW